MDSLIFHVPEAVISGFNIGIATIIATSQIPAYAGLTVVEVPADLTVAIGVGVAIGLALRLRRRQIPPARWSEPDR